MRTNQRTRDFTNLTSASKRWGITPSGPIGILTEDPPESENYRMLCGGKHGGMTSYDTGISNCRGCIDNLNTDVRSTYDKARKKFLEESKDL